MRLRAADAVLGNTAQFTADALSVTSLADFPATVTKMLANTQSIRCAFCLTCQKTGRRDSALRIVRYCPKKKLLARPAHVRAGKRVFNFFLRRPPRYGETALTASAVTCAAPPYGRVTSRRYSRPICGGNRWRRPVCSVRCTRPPALCSAPYSICAISMQSLSCVPQKRCTSTFFFASARQTAAQSFSSSGVHGDCSASVSQESPVYSSVRSSISQPAEKPAQTCRS